VVHAQRYLAGQRLQASHWLGAHAGELVWCTAASGWSKSARNVFIAPWLLGAAALLHDGRFDPHERLELLARERVKVLCMAPTEYRVLAKRTTLRELPDLRGMVAAGEALNPEVLRAWREATGLDVRDGYGQTETGQMTGTPPGVRARPGSMGQALPGVGLLVKYGELTANPATVPTFFLGYLGEHVRRAEDGGWRVDDRRRGGPWRTGDLVQQDEDGWLHFEGRDDDVIMSAGYRIGPFESSPRSSPTRPSPRRRPSPRPTRSVGRSCARSSCCAMASTPPRPSWYASCRSMSSAKQRPTSTRASSTSQRSCRRPPAGRSGGQRCAPSDSRPPPRGVGRRAAGSGELGCGLGRRVLAVELALELVDLLLHRARGRAQRE